MSNVYREVSNVYGVSQKNVVDNCDIVVSEFKFQSLYLLHLCLDLYFKKIWKFLFSFQESLSKY